MWGVFATSILQKLAPISRLNYLLTAPQINFQCSLNYLWLSPCFLENFWVAPYFMYLLSSAPSSLEFFLCFVN